MSIPLPTIDHPQRKQILERNLKRLKCNKLEYHNKLVDIEVSYHSIESMPERLKIDYDWLYNNYIETNNDIELIERELESCRTKQN